MATVASLRRRLEALEAGGSNERIEAVLDALASFSGRGVTPRHPASWSSFADFLRSIPAAASVSQSGGTVAQTGTTTGTNPIPA